MRNALLMAALLVALCCPASAGIINNPSTPVPLPTPPPTTAQTAEEPAPTDEEPTTTGEGTDGAAPSLTEIMLDILTVLPSLL